MDILRSVPMMRIRAFGSFCSTEFQSVSVACVIPDRDSPDGENKVSEINNYGIVSVERAKTTGERFNVEQRLSSPKLCMEQKLKANFPILKH